MIRILELIHDYDHPDVPSNVDLWAFARRKVVTARHYAYKDTDYPDPKEFDLLIIHGGSQHLWDKERDPWLIEEIHFVKAATDAGIPVIGFCLGSQIIAEVFGGIVFHSQEKETGIYQIKPYEGVCGHPILHKLETGFLTFEWHSDHYTLPEGFQTIAYSERAANQIIVGSNRPVVGFQFHSEYTKRIITTYTGNFPEEGWNLEEGPVELEHFIREINRREDTYELFERLIENTLSYFRTEFKIQLL